MGDIVKGSLDPQRQEASEEEGRRVQTGSKEGPGDSSVTIPGPCADSTFWDTENNFCTSLETYWMYLHFVWVWQVSAAYSEN